MRTTFYSLPVDYFLWSDKSSTQQKLVYYDENGQAHEKEVPKEQLEKALKFFDGKLYSISRTNGGLVNAEPYELVICECKRPGMMMEPEVRIGLRFTDLKRDRTRMVTSNEVLYQTKYVTPDELGPAIDWTESNQKYVLEFGRGLVPVRVLQFVQTAKGVQALFVREDELKAASNKEAGQETEVNVYQVPRDILRQARPLFGGRTNEFEVAAENVNWLKQTGDTVIPSVLKTSEVTLKAGHSLSTQLNILQKSLLLQKQSQKRSKKGSERLIPFGVFEVR